MEETLNTQIRQNELELKKKKQELEKIKRLPVRGEYN